eukprot:m.13230 g.13230  ORF g.13230 m.13230 type:complete len:1127 (+) comp10075_c0_seq1:130-3510(+)
MPPSAASASSGTSVYLRRTEISDAAAIAELITPATAQLFGSINLISIIEKAILGITVVDERGGVVGHASFSDSPTVPQVSTRSWTEWLATHFHAPHVQPINTVFLSLFVVQQSLGEQVSEEILRTLFVAAPSIRQCVAVIPKGEPAYASSPLSPHFTSFERASPCDFDVLECKQSVLSPSLFVRPAEPEDFDDLRLIFDRQSDVLEDQYGGDYFFIAELIEASLTAENAPSIEEDVKQRISQCLVAVVAGRAVGLMSLSSDVDLTVLRECFQLSPYNDIPKAVAITLFCIDPQFESHSLDFMPAVFDRYPDHDWCLLTMPYGTAELPLLQSFTRVHPRSESILPHGLWLMHRAGLVDDVSIRPLVAEDASAVKALVSNTLGDAGRATVGTGDSALSMVDLVAHSLDTALTDAARVENTKGGVLLHGAFVVEACGSPVGVVLCRSAKDDAPQLRAQYNIEEFILYAQHASFEHGYIDHFILSPLFERHTKYVLREVMRLFGKSCVYSRLYTDVDVARLEHKPTVPGCLNAMVPVRRRRQIEFPLEVLKTNVPSEHVRVCDPPFALMFLNRKLMLEPKVNVSSRIVVIGASDTGLGFLEAIVTKSHLRLAAVTVVSDNGLPEFPSETPARGIADSHAYTQRAAKTISWESFATVVKDRMVGIDREERHVVLASGALVAYDYLILTPGLQYHPPPESICDDNSGVNVLAPSGMRDVATMVKTCNSVPTVVYGSSVDALAAVQAILTAGGDASHVTLVAPTQLEPMLERVCQALTDAGVKVCSGATLASVRNGTCQLSDGTSIPCKVLVSLDRKTVNRANFTAVNDSCLVFDGRLVVNNIFATNDPRIYAAGPFTKYSRKYAAGVAQPGTYNSVELGHALATRVLQKIDPLTESPAPVPNGDKVLPTMTRPVVTGAVLPGGFHYLRISPPGGCPAAAERGDRILRTTTSKGVFEVCIDRYSKVSEICILHLPVGDDNSAAAPLLSASNIACLYGVHQRFLNNVVERFDEGLIADFFHYFREPWVMAVYHDRFVDFVADVTEAGGTHPSVDVKSFETAVRRLAALRVSGKQEEPRVVIGDTVTSDASAKLLADAAACVDTDSVASLARSRLMEFLTYNSYHLPMYARPMSW